MNFLRVCKKEGGFRAAAQNTALRIGYSGLKDLQMDVVIGIATGRDVFVVLPTGYRKSLHVLRNVFQSCSTC